MSEWTRPAQPVRCAVELDKPLVVRRERGVLAQGDANANAIVAEVYQTAGKPFDLTGCTVMLTFVRPDNLALPPIEAEISGNTAIATLKDACYEVSGVYVATMQLRKDGAERTILWLIGDVKGKDIDGIVDPDHEIISVEDLMATAAEAQKAANAANTAAERANAGAERAEQLQIDASGLAGDSNKLGGKAPEHYLPAVQLLDNPDFSIAQAGYNKKYGNELYHADRWWGNGAGTLSVSGDVKTFASISGFAIMKQNLWNDGRDHGKAYTLVVTLPDGTRLVGNGVAPSAASTGEQVFIDITAPDSRCWFMAMKEANDLMSVRVDASQAGASVNFLYIDLFEGVYTAESAPAHVPPDHTLELAKCQYYAQVVDLDIWSTFADGYADSNGYFSAIIPIATMRKGNPDIILPSSGLYVDGEASKPFTGTITKIRNCGNYLEIQAQNSYFTAGHHSISTRDETVKVLIDMNL